MNPAEFLLDLANGNTTDVSVPSELDDKVHMENHNLENNNSKIDYRPSAQDVHEVKHEIIGLMLWCMDWFLTVLNNLFMMFCSIW